MRVLSSLKAKTSGPQPLGQLRLDLFRLLTSAAGHHQIVGVAHQHRGARRGLDTASTASEVPDPGGRSIPCRATFKEQGTDHATLRAPSSVGANRPLLDHPRLQPGADQFPAGERAELAENEVVVDPVERRRQVRVENP